MSNEQENDNKHVTKAPEELPLHKIVLIDPNDPQLHPAEYNQKDKPSPEEENALIQSLLTDKDFLLRRPILVNFAKDRYKTVYAGWHRLLAVRKIGWEKVPIFVDLLDLATEQRYSVKDNFHTTHYAPGALGLIFQNQLELGTDMNSLGFVPELVIEQINLTTGGTTPLDPTKDPDYQGTTPRSKKTKKHEKIIEELEQKLEAANTLLVDAVDLVSRDEKESALAILSKLEYTLVDMANLLHPDN